MQCFIFVIGNILYKIIVDMLLIFLSLISELILKPSFLSCRYGFVITYYDTQTYKFIAVNHRERHHTSLI